MSPAIVLPALKRDATGRHYRIVGMTDNAAYDRYIKIHPSPDWTLMASELERELLELRRYNLLARLSPDVDERVQARMALVYAREIYRELRTRDLKSQAVA
jgi:hypothetical protein